MNVIEVKGLKEITDAMEKFPEETQKAADKTMDTALIYLWENVPEYPPPPENSTYRRTGTLGKSMGSIYKVSGLGAEIEGRFGTNLEYSPYVIGDGTQAAIHEGRWWTMKTIADKSQAGVIALFDTMMEKLAAWLNTKGA